MSRESDLTRPEGSIVRVDLTTGKIAREPLSLELREKYAGGRGINVRILFDEVGRDVDPLAPENRLIFGTSPLSGTAAPAAARFNVTAKSPQTGILGDANAGGRFGPSLKRAGVDHLVIEGRADAPVYLWIKEGEVEIRPARHLWGKDIRETDRLIKEEVGDSRARIAGIGRAGERCVRIASIMHEDRAAARTGMGAVMGSKNLKAVAVRGSGRVPLFDAERFNALARQMQKRIAASPAYDGFRKHAGIGGVVPTNRAGILAVRNYQSAGEFPEIDRFDSARVAEKYFLGSRPCHGCPVGCGNRYEIKDGPHAGVWGDKIEEGAFTPLGPVCGNSDLDSIFKMNSMANDLGIDLLEAGQTMAMVMEWYENGIVSQADLDGIPLTFGNHEAMIRMLERIGLAEGVGEILSRGAAAAAEHFGGEAKKYACHSKGMVMSGVDPRMIKGTALGFATSTRGADLLRCTVPVEFKWFYRMDPKDAVARFGTEDALEPSSYNKASATIYFQHHNLVNDLFEVCVFAVRGSAKDCPLDELCRLYSLATGIETDESAILSVAERVYNLERAYICREGIRRSDDRLLGKWGADPIPNGPYKGDRLDPAQWEEMLDSYYRARGWDANGVPEREKLEAIGLGDAARVLEKAGAYT